MGKKRKKYLVTSNSEAFACSLVTSPAVEEQFVAFNEEKPMIEKFADEKKHMVTGVVAIPNKPIFRRNADGEEYDIVFSAEAIEAMAKNYMKEYKQHEVTLQHQENADGVYLVEQWIKDDMVYDKSLAVGLSRELPVGSWIQTYYVDSTDVWKRIESGELLGFSLECMLGLEEFESQIKDVTDNNDNTIMNFSDESFWTKLKQVLKEAFSKEDTEEVVEAKLEEQTTTTEVKTEEPVETAVEPSKVEEPTPTKEEVKEEPVAKTVEEKEDSTEPKTEPKQEDNHLAELINSLKEEINALKEMNTGLQSKIKKLEIQPSVKPVSTVAKQNAGDTYANWRKMMGEYLA